MSSVDFSFVFCLHLTTIQKPQAMSLLKTAEKFVAAVVRSRIFKAHLRLFPPSHVGGYFFNGLLWQLHHPIKPLRILAACRVHYRCRKVGRRHERFKVVPIGVTQVRFELHAVGLSGLRAPGYVRNATGESDRLEDWRVGEGNQISYDPRSAVSRTFCQYQEAVGRAGYDSGKNLVG